ncbi:DUF4249 domain-containing protein [Flavobacterium psychrotolerans]|uniref:DUF4249 domain-containing protein n=1 Tax=Flavobacterium psychrotolerans TaxID=2169410 RepID=A0A2U1JJ44_9FLAO|nr:DUF4249 domain-containing protein [Flavobacterium psychrotolerans]PWA05024.1 DUF4249 domain-containing protein [Flavobacterium psychrotolerans]
MKNLYVLVVLLTALFFNGCEDVVNVDLNSAPPKLVIDGAINWQKGTLGNTQTIRLSTTSDYFSSAKPTVSGATVFVKNSENTVFTFAETSNTGNYVCTNFIPHLNETYTLTVVSAGQTYMATETLTSIAPIKNIVQNNEGGFTGTDIEIKAFYTDPANEENYYLYKYKYPNQIKSGYYVDDDTFFQGNDFFSLSQNNDIKAGDQIEISHFGISKAYYNYMSVLLSIAGNTGGGPFQSPPATVRGNIINTTNFSNYALGYFRLCEVETKNYTVQ